jgi:hypothetical protein
MIIGSANAITSNPRGWLVSKGDSQAVLVAESHVRSPIEFDPYFNSVVKPSFNAAQIAVHESFFGAAQTQNEDLYRAAPCLVDNGSPRTERLKPAFDELIKTTKQSNLEVPVWMAQWNLIPEFLFTSLFMDPFIDKALEFRFTTDSKKHSDLLGASFQLAHDAKISKTSSKLIGLDSLKALKEHFCTANASERQDYLFDDIVKNTNRLRMKLNDPKFESRNKILISAGHVLNEAINCIDKAVVCAISDESTDTKYLRSLGLVPGISDGSFTIVIKKRTHAWVPIIQQAIESHKKTFIIVGALHLPDLRVNDRIEPGLISQLRKQGFTVRPIYSDNEIKDTFLAKSAFEKVLGFFKTSQ